MIRSLLRKLLARLLGDPVSGARTRVDIEDQLDPTPEA